MEYKKVKLYFLFINGNGLIKLINDYFYDIKNFKEQSSKK
ncbi:hypothetical protein OMHANJPE_00554 [Mycoplasmopsis arginini]|nr:hypothetical protein [Mycoplasmopsis arginini]